MNVDAELIVHHGVADGDVAQQIAEVERNHTTCSRNSNGVENQHNQDCGPEIGGDKPAGTVFIGISSDEHGKAFGPYHFSGHGKEICEAWTAQCKESCLLFALHFCHIRPHINRAITQSHSV